MNISQILRKALALHQAGKLDEAEPLYRKAVAKKPGMVDAHNLLGALLQQKGDLPGAVRHTGQAVRIDPAFHAAWVNHGNALQASGEVEAAVKAFRTADRLKPGDADVLSNLASALNDAGDHGAALEAANGAIAVNPAHGDAHNNRGLARMRSGELEAALADFDRSLALGSAKPGDVAYNRGHALMRLARFEKARTAYTQALAAERGDAERWFNLANALHQLDRLDEAVQAFRKAIELRPGFVAAQCNLASALQDGGRTGDAIAYLDSAIETEPDAPDLQWNRSLSLLQNGDMKAGFEAYEVRWRTPSFRDYERAWDAPRWRGGDVTGKRVLVHWEQGFGDGLMFCRYVPLLAARGATVLVECRKGLKRLFDTLEGAAEVFDLGDPPPAHNLQVPMMSLPHLFGTDLDTVPAGEAYLRVPRGTTTDSRVHEPAKLKAGLVWAGSPTRKDNHKRSIPLEALAPLFGLAGVTYFSFQKGPFEAELANSAFRDRIVDLAPCFGDFADTAAALTAMDVVVSVDTGVLHLAGALGAPVLAMMSQPTGFFWMNERADSPWYPNTRLFRQPKPGDWEPVVAGVKKALEERLA